MTVVEAHVTRHGYEITARLIDSEGKKVVFTAAGPDFEEVQERLINMLELAKDRVGMREQSPPSDLSENQEEPK